MRAILIDVSSNTVLAPRWLFPFPPRTSSTNLFFRTHANVNPSHSLYSVVPTERVRVRPKYLLPPPLPPIKPLPCV